MRAELALIISIICFCCWCAYILVKMSYSTSTSSVTTSTGAAATNSPGSAQAASMNHPALAQPYQQLHYYPPSRGYFLNDYQPLTHRLPEASTANQYYPRARPPYSSAIVATTWPTSWLGRKANVEYPVRANWITPTNLSSSVYAAHPATRWQTQAELNAVQPAATELEPEPDNLEGSEDTEAQAPETETQESDTETEEPQQESGDDATSEDELEPEVEERGARRSFSEDHSESTERDRNGRPIVTRRRHIVNGKPVKLKGVEETQNFDSVVSEIDAAEADRNQRQEVGKQQVARESRPAGSISSLGVSRMDNKKARIGGAHKKVLGKPRDSHQHRLSESLSAQQWDDDSSNTGGGAAKDKVKVSEKELEPELKEEDEQEDEGNNLLDDELDMFAGSTEFPFVQPVGQTRLKRNILSHETKSNKDLKQAEDLAVEVIEQNSQQAAPTQPSQVREQTQIDQNSPSNYPWPPLVSPPAVDQVNTQQASPFISNGHTGGTSEYQPIQSPNHYYLTTMWNPDSIFTLKNPLASGSKSKVSKKKQQKKFKKSAMSDSKYKAANAHKIRKMSKFKKGGSKKKKKSAKKKLSKKSKEFLASTRGKKGNKGHGQQGAKKGALYINDKGYKKKGFKKAYRKIEAGDHKTYFDTFRDKDHNKNWKKYKDKHHYSQSKKWAGNEAKKFKNFNSKESKKKNSHSADWKDRAGSRYRKDSKYKKGYESAKRKKKKKSHEESEHYS